MSITKLVPRPASCPKCDNTGYRTDWRTYCSCQYGQERERNEKTLTIWGERIPNRFQDYRLATATEPNAAKIVAKWVDDEDWSRGSNLILGGHVGTGKTGFLIGAAWEILNRWEIAPTFVGVPSMLDQMRPQSTDDPMPQLMKARILLLDDLGVERSSDWVRERLYVLINSRYEAKKPTLVTTNRDLGQLAEAIGERTVSRLQEDATIVPIAGTDRRRG